MPVGPLKATWELIISYVGPDWDFDINASRNVNHMDKYGLKS